MINQITKVRLPDGQEVALTDWSSRPLYSTIDLLSGFTDQEIRAFNYANSDTVSSSANVVAAARRTASLRDTNVSAGNEMDSTEEFLVYSIKVEMHQFAFDDQNNTFLTNATGLPIPVGPIMSLLHNRLILELEVSKKAFPQAGLGWFAQGFGPVIAAVTPDAGTVRTYANNGLQTHEASDVLPIPVHLGGTEDYAVILHNPPNGMGQTGNGAVTFMDEAGSAASTAAIQLRIYLCGLHKRPVG